MGIHGIDDLKPGGDQNNDEPEYYGADGESNEGVNQVEELPQPEAVYDEVYDGDVNVDTDEDHADDEAGLEDTAEPAEMRNVFDNTSNVESVAQEVLRGEWGTGQERRQALDAAGYDPNEVEAEVKRIVNERKTV